MEGSHSGFGVTWAPNCLGVKNLRLLLVLNSYPWPPHQVLSGSNHGVVRPGRSDWVSYLPIKHHSSCMAPDPNQRTVKVNRVCFYKVLYLSTAPDLFSSSFILFPGWFVSEKDECREATYLICGHLLSSFVHPNIFPPRTIILPSANNFCLLLLRHHIFLLYCFSWNFPNNMKRQIILFHSFTDCLCGFTFKFKLAVG